MKVGITIVAKPGDSIWKNGIMQNCVYLYEVFDKCPSVSEIFFIQCGMPEDWNDDDKKWPYPEYNYTFINNGMAEQIADEFDVMVSLGAVPAPNNLKTFKSRPNNKFVQYKGGNEFINEIESILYGQYIGWPNVKLEVGKFDPVITDELWMVPQQEFHNKDYMSIKHRTVARSVPFVWGPKYIKEAEGSLIRTETPGSLEFSKKDFSKGFTWASFEPNMSVLKNMAPIIWAGEHLHRTLKAKGDDKLKSVMITNAAGHMENQSLLNMMANLDIFKDKKISFEGRYSTPYVLHKYAHGVISHQWGNALNYAYLDACYFGIPLVHNASLCPDLGYYYEEWKLKDAAKNMEMAQNHHHEDTGYRDRQRALLHRYTVDNPAMIAQYDLLLRNLFEPNEINDAHKFNTSTNLIS